MEKRKAQKKELTLLQAIEKVVEFVEDGELSKESLRKAKPYSSFLAKSFGITELQAVFFCISLEQGPGRVDLNDIARFLGMSKIRALSYADEIGALVNRRLMRYRNAKDEQKFHANFNEAAMNPPRPDVDTIFKLIVVTIDRDYDDEGNPLPLYPSFRVDATECYYCRTLVKAERILRRRVIKERKKKECNEEVHNEIYCFYITELPLEHKITEYVPGEYLTCRAYDSNGLLADKSKAGNICLREDIKTDCTHLSYPLFRGRSEDEIRFKPGDIVEVMDGTDIRLAVITGIPPTIEQCWEYHMRLKSLSLEPECRKRPHHYMRDYSDDSYIVVDSAPDNQLWHDHVNCIFLFSPRFPVPEEVEQRFNRIFEEWKAL